MTTQNHVTECNSELFW